MGLTLFSAGLFANMPAPSFEVTIPRDREPIYEVVAPLFLALAVAAGGLWCARRHALRPDTRRALLWLSGGCLAVAYSSWWMWDKRNAGIVEPNLATVVAVSMPGLWMLFCAVVLLAGRRPRGDRPEQGSPKRTKSEVELKSELEEVAVQVNPHRPIESPPEVNQQTSLSKAKGVKANLGGAIGITLVTLVLLISIGVALGYILWHTGFVECSLLVIIVVAIGLIVSRRM